MMLAIQLSSLFVLMYLTPAIGAVMFTEITKCTSMISVIFALSATAFIWSIGLLP